MKKFWIMIILALLLTGCGTQETFETVADEFVQPAAAMQREILLSIPPGAAVPSMVAQNNDKLYMCKGFSLTVQTMEAGDLNKTIREISGFDMENLTVLETAQEDLPRYDFIWASVGEGGDQVGRAAIVDDGNYHYVVTTMAAETDAGQLQESWDRIFDSFWAA